MGCGECKLLRLLKLEHYIEELYGVDVEGSLLERSQYLITPLTTDYIHKRPLPLHIFLMKGLIRNNDYLVMIFDYLVTVTNNIWHCVLHWNYCVLKLAFC